MFVDCPPSSSASFLSFSIPRLFFQVDEHMERWKQRTDFVLGAFKKETDQFVAEITVIADDWSIPDFWSAILPMSIIKARLCHRSG